MTPQEAIALILNAHGVPVLAHPADIAFTVPDLAAAGLAGIEVYYPFYSPDTIAFLRQLAQQHHLICTGGSDFHGLGLLPDNRLGGVCVPASCVTALCRRRQHLGARNG
jgi:predicted metal-dependent phosphoesterase TrpH